MNLWLVDISQRATPVPEDQLELVPEEPETPVELLRSGRVGGAIDLRRLLTHVRLTGRLANVIYSMDTTGTDFYAYQFKPVLKLINSATERGILIADEVGLGKTIEAGLIWTELRSRYDYRRLLVLCPAMLREKWRLELHRRFGVEADVVDAAGLLQRLRRADEEGSTAQFAMISSIQGVRPRRGWNEAASEEEGGPGGQLARFLDSRSASEALVDLLVIDEAHYLRNPETMTATAGQLFRDVSHQLVLLSATPIHLKSNNLYHLLRLLDADTFYREQAFQEILEANAPLVRARDLVLSGRGTSAAVRALLEEAANHPLLKGSRQLEGLLSDSLHDDQLQQPNFASHLAYRLETVNLLGHVLTRTRKRDVTERRVVRNPFPEPVPLTAVEREFYETVTGLVREYSSRMAAHEGFLAVIPQRQISSSMPAAFRAWRQRQYDLDDEEGRYEDLGDEENDSLARREEPGPLIRELIRHIDEAGNFELLKANDSKYARLREILSRFFEEHPREKVVLFSYFRETLRYLRERLDEDGIDTFTIHGGTVSKHAVLARFQGHTRCAVLLSSEVGSEGIDLQFSRVLINYDLPWNPMKVEQRIGRLDRLGQHAPVIVIWNLFYEDTIDARIYYRLLDRLEVFQHALGGLEPVVGENIQRLAIDLLRNRLTPAQEERIIDQTAIAIENRNREEERLEGEAASLVAYGDYVLDQVRAARDLYRRVDGQDLCLYVKDFVSERYPGSEFRQTSDALDFLVTLSNDAKYEFDRFLREQRLEPLTRLARVEAREVRCRFENRAVAQAGNRTELLSQFHPLVRFVGARISELGRYGHPAVAVQLASDLTPRISPGAYAFAAQRWSIRGLQTVEQLHYEAVPLANPDTQLEADDAERLVVAASIHGEDWLEALSELDYEQLAHIANERCMLHADQAYDRFVRELTAHNEDRADIQERTARHHYETQRARLEGLIESLERAGRRRIAQANRGRVNALEDRMSRRLRDISQRRGIEHSKEEICVGVILVGGRANLHHG